MEHVIFLRLRLLYKATAVIAQALKVFDDVNKNKGALSELPQVALEKFKQEHDKLKTWKLECDKTLKEVAKAAKTGASLLALSFDLKEVTQVISLAKSTANSVGEMLAQMASLRTPVA